MGTNIMDILMIMKVEIIRIHTRLRNNHTPTPTRQQITLNHIPIPIRRLSQLRLQSYHPEEQTAYLV
jgi:hypothetical protein